MPGLEEIPGNTEMSVKNKCGQEYYFLPIDGLVVFGRKAEDFGLRKNGIRILSPLFKAGQVTLG